MQIPNVCGCSRALPCCEADRIDLPLDKGALGFVMTLREAGMAVVAAAVLVFGVVGAAWAQTADLWTVTNVAVDATGASPSAAKDAAISKGRQKAWTEVFRRITPSAQWQAQPPLTDQQLEGMVKSFDIANEKHSSTRYLATVTYVFNASAVRTALRSSGTQFSESKAKPVLVVALSGSAWAPESAWGKAWAAQSQRGRLVPVTVPRGDDQDRAALATISTAADWAVVKPLADRYGASSVLVATAGKSGGGIAVNLAHIKPDGRTPRSGSYAPQGGEDELALASRAAGTIADSLQEEWKRSTSVDYGTQASLTASVAFNSLAEWVATRRGIQGTKLVQVLAVEELNMRGARVRLDYVGKVDQLQTALSQTNLYLSSDAQGNWTLSRNAGATTAKPGSVVP
jgi:hypothetical protein